MVVPLSQAEILGLLDRSPEYGPLTDPSRRASCLSGLGYPASTQVLGARPIDINARPGVLLVLPGDTPDNLAVFAVAPNCSAADTGLLANTQSRALSVMPRVVRRRGNSNAYAGVRHT